MHGYPKFTCFELGLLPAPAARYLWREGDEPTWQRLYGEWLRQWEGGSYKMAELFHVDSSGNVNRRTEMWLVEVDEFGMVLMAEGKIVTHHSLIASFTARVTLTSTKFLPFPAHERLSKITSGEDGKNKEKESKVKSKF